MERHDSGAVPHGRYIALDRSVAGRGDRATRAALASCDGHGDCFSAFSLALLLADELGMAKPKRWIGAITDNSFSKNSVDYFAMRQAEYEAEQEAMEAAGYDYDGREEFAKAMRFLGR